MQDVWKGWLAAAAAIACWVTLVATWWLLSDGDGRSGLFALMAALMPTVLILLLAQVLQQLGSARAQVARLTEERPAPAPQGNGLPRAEIDRMFNRLTERQQVSDRALLALLEGRAADRTVLAEVAQNSARAASIRPTPPPRVVAQVRREPGQPSLPLGGAEPDQAEEAPAWADLIRALNFPQDQDDAAGFRAMHRVMRDRQIAQVLRAAEDVLNLLSQDGIYMDDLDPVAADPALWRKFAQGERGVDMAGLAAIDDPTALSLTRGRMRSDDVMRDAALHFIRHFDIFLKGLCERMDDDTEIARLSATRTGRAFMLLATVAGALE